MSVLAFKQMAFARRILPAGRQAAGLPFFLFLLEYFKLLTKLPNLNYESISSIILLV